MNLQRLFSRAIISMMAVALLHVPCSAETTQRENVLAKHFPEGLANLPPESKKMALKYGSAWMSIIATVGTSGFKKPDTMKAVYEKELLPMIQPLKGGNKFEKDAFAAGVKIYEALHHLSSKLSGRTVTDDDSLEALVRYKPGNENIPHQLSEGISELLFDYMQLLAPDVFEQAQKQLKARQP